MGLVDAQKINQSSDWGEIDEHPKSEVATYLEDREELQRLFSGGEDMRSPAWRKKMKEKLIP